MIRPQRHGAASPAKPSHILRPTCVGPGSRRVHARFPCARNHRLVIRGETDGSGEDRRGTSRVGQWGSLGSRPLAAALLRRLHGHHLVLLARPLQGPDRVRDRRRQRHQSRHREELRGARCQRRHLRAHAGEAGRGGRGTARARRDGVRRASRTSATTRRSRRSSGRRNRSSAPSTSSWPARPATSCAPPSSCRPTGSRRSSTSTCWAPSTRPAPRSSS